MHDSGEGHVTAGGQAPTHGGPVSARGVSRLAWSGAITAIVLVATSVALFVQGAGRLEDFGGPTRSPLWPTRWWGRWWSPDAPTTPHYAEALTASNRWMVHFVPSNAPGVFWRIGTGGHEASAPSDPDVAGWLPAGGARLGTSLGA